MKLWGGRFEKQTSKEVDDFHSSIHFDYRLYHQDIIGSIAHAKMLGETGIISNDESQMICTALEEILDEIKKGVVSFDIDAEDIHMNIEKILISRIGETGKKLHTGRSRNDQVALDTRMYTKDAIEETKSKLLDLENVILEIAQAHKDTIIAGYTHLQKAQPTTLAHHVMAYFEMFRRDYARFTDCYKRTDVMPLGSGALAGTVYPLDRTIVAAYLDFSKISRNSMDAVSDRDFAIEFLSCSAILMMHLSRFCEELIIWSSHEFQYVEIDDSFSTGSSIMPQKKNPDVAELIRGKTGRVYGDLFSLLTIMKGLPLAYNKDMQEDKEALFDAMDTVQKCLSIFTSMLKTTKFNKKRMYELASGGFTNATDAADYLVSKGMAFRDAHEVIGHLILYCIKTKKDLLDLTLEEFQNFSSLFQCDIFRHLSLETCVNQRKVSGGPAIEIVGAAIEDGKKWIESTK